MPVPFPLYKIQLNLTRQDILTYLRICVVHIVTGDRVETGDGSVSP